ncbi:RloB domain-containing protein [Nonomuraea sp. K274]|uniref:RloB domain-containing protein n=1 Tax=Nonomuraea cypriaca TaxID=1187855 RepID=A0A931A7U2_9ACTN|nr:RloB family protein [Nonomuraea cypriaca]MBF8186264.1 RloB domain-containing protein [Nonomuraea cypriaca]
MSRTRGKDTLGPPKQQHGRRNRVVHVFTEGELTEPSYIDIMKQVLKDQAFAVDIRIANASAPGSRRKPINLVEAAVPLMRELTREAKGSQLRKELWPQVWCLFDRDDHQQLDQALKQAREGQVGIAFSHPCFEVWRLLHHRDVTGTFNQMCDLVTARLPFRKTENIKRVCPEHVLGSFAKAKKRALRMNAQHGDHVPLPNRDPYTDVFHFVEQGLGLTSY